MPRSAKKPRSADLKEYLKKVAQVRYNTLRYTNLKTGKWYFGENREKFKNVTCAKLEYLKNYFISIRDTCPYKSEALCHCRMMRPMYINALEKVINMTDENSEDEIEKSLQELYNTITPK